MATKRVEIMILKTQRLILRPWNVDDAETLYKYASNPNIGPIAGWPVHTSVENSRQVIKDVLSEEETYAVVLQQTGEPVGSIGLMIGNKSNLKINDDEGEIVFGLVNHFGARDISQKL